VTTEAPTIATVATVNIAARLAEVADRLPNKPAVIACIALDGAGRTVCNRVTFAELARDVDAYARGLERAGFTRGMRTILMVRPGRVFFALTFALMKIGAVPVLIDPGMGRRRLIACLANVEAEAFIGIPLAHVARTLFRRAFRTVRLAVTVGRRVAWGGLRLEDVYAASDEPIAPAPTAADDTAAILFTSGSTGPAKGVVYTHGIFDAQIRYLESQYGYSPDEVDLATFPLFALFDAALGMTAVIPEMNPSRPADADPRRIIAALTDHSVTHMFGSPALLNRVSRHAVELGISLPGIKRVMTAGAPVPAAVLERMRQILPAEADIFTPYGATEALPIASIESREILGETAADTAAGAGICVGRPLPGIDVRIIGITDAPIATMAEANVLSPGVIGEICVRGPVVTRKYFNHADANAAAKIADGATLWHRMGDAGYLDASGRLWFCGRKAHRVHIGRRVLFTICCEAVFNQHPEVYRTALVGVGPAGVQTPILCVELEGPAAHVTKKRIECDLRQLGGPHDHTRIIEKFLFHRSFPVDVRHNAKIFREQLTVWAAKQLGASVPNRNSATLVNEPTETAPPGADRGAGQL